MVPVVEQNLLFYQLNFLDLNINFYRPKSIKEIVLQGLQSNTTKQLEVVEVEGTGLGVVAGENILKHQFVCEYKYSLSYGREERASHEQEYAINEEGCYVLEVQLPTGKWLCLDANRNYNSFGRLINHSRPASVCLSQTAQPPLHERKVEGGFVLMSGHREGGRTFL